eukprot:Selendium_serpulae@DN3303_c0_g1_i1.p1
MAPPPRWHDGLDAGKKIYIGNLDPQVTSQTLQDMFSKFGNIQTVWVARSPPGFAFVTFDDDRDSEDAVKAKDGSKLHDKHIRVEVARGPRPGKESFGQGREVETSIVSATETEIAGTHIRDKIPFIATIPLLQLTDAPEEVTTSNRLVPRAVPGGLTISEGHEVEAGVVVTDDHFPVLERHFLDTVRLPIDLSLVI